MAGLGPANHASVSCQARIGVDGRAERGRDALECWRVAHVERTALGARMKER
jgi:hypothetical protein